MDIHVEDWNPDHGFAHLGDDLRVPARLTFTATGGDLPYEVELVAVVREDRYVCKSVTFHAEDGAEVTTDGLRQVPVTGIMRTGLQHATQLPLFTAAPDPDNPRIKTSLDFVALAKAAEEGPTDRGLQAAAVAYRISYALGYSPTKSVAKALGLTHSTAARWVARARERGFLGQTSQGRAGGVTAEED